MPKLSVPTVGRITSPFGPRPKYGDHHGVDYGWVKGTDYVYAAAPGKIVEVYYSTGLGNLITIDIGGGFKNRYCHLKNKGVVKVGQTVKRRQKIGTKGETGTAAFGRHLHFELWRNGTRIDPAPYMVGATPPLKPSGDITPTGTEDLMPMKIIAPYGMPDRAVIGGGLAYAFPNEGEFKHFLNLNGLGTPDTVKVTIVGDAKMSKAQRRAVFKTLVKIYT